VLEIALSVVAGRTAGRVWFWWVELWATADAPARIALQIEGDSDCQPIAKRPRLFGQLAQGTNLLDQ
jgi:hypothetical protein